MHILITGERNVGKSTIVEKIMSRIDVQPTGFITRPHFDDQNKLVGFVMMEPSMNNKGKFEHNQIIGHTGGVDWEACPETFDNYGVSLLETTMLQKNTIILMDELGFFESDAKIFQEKVMACLDQNEIQVIAVVKKAQSDFLDAIRSHPNAELYYVDHSNRDLLPEMLVSKIKIE